MPAAGLLDIPFDATLYLILAFLAYLLYRLARLDYLRRIAGVAGFACGAMVEAFHLGLDITFRVLSVWALAGFLVTAVLFQREIKQRLR